MDQDYYTDSWGDDSHIPRIEIEDLHTIKDIELELATNHDEFYRRIITFVIDVIENKLPADEPLAILIDTDGEQYAMELPTDGFVKALTKCMEYFTAIEEYESCTLVNDLIKISEEGL